MKIIKILKLIFINNYFFNKYKYKLILLKMNNYITKDKETVKLNIIFFNIVIFRIKTFLHRRR